MSYRFHPTGSDVLPSRLSPVRVARRVVAAVFVLGSFAAFCALLAIKLS